MTRSIWRCGAVIAGMVGGSLGARAEAPSPIGFWVTQDHGGVVEIVACPTGLCGRIVGMRTDLPRGEDRKDVKNSDHALRGRSICGMMMIGGLEPDKSNPAEWKKGWVYDPESGDTYSAQMRLEGPTILKLRGYLGISLFGRSETWTREAGGSPNRCAAVPPA